MLIHFDYDGNPGGLLDHLLDLTGRVQMQLQCGRTPRPEDLRTIRNLKMGGDRPAHRDSRGSDPPIFFGDVSSLGGKTHGKFSPESPKFWNTFPRTTRL